MGNKVCDIVLYIYTGYKIKEKENLKLISTASKCCLFKEYNNNYLCDLITILKII